MSKLLDYYSLFNNVASYAILSGGNSYKNTAESLIKLQKRITKVIRKTDDSTFTNTHYVLQTLTYNYGARSKAYSQPRSVTRYGNKAGKNEGITMMLYYGSINSLLL